MGWLSDLSRWQAVALALIFAAVVGIAVQGWFLTQLFRQHGRLLLRQDVLEATLIGSGLPAPDFAK